MTRRVSALAPPALLGALLALNILMGMHRWMPDFTVVRLLAPTPESVLAAALAFFVSRIWRRRVVLLYSLPAAVLAAIMLFGLGEGFYRAVFRQNFVPRTDLNFLPALLNMVTGTEAFDRPLLIAAAATIIVLAVATILLGLLCALDRSYRRISRLWTYIIWAAVLSLGIAVIPGGVEAPVTVKALRQLRRPAIAAPSEDALPVGFADSADPATPAPEKEYALPGIKDRDIHLLIVESYGHTLFTREGHWELMGPVYDRLQDALTGAGFSVWSNFLSSPAFGGRSWLADATILTGKFIDTQEKYDAVLETAAQHLTRILGEAGYRRVLAAPGTDEADEEWRAFYAFDRYLFRQDFGYAGPAISFGGMPDQFLLHRTSEVLREEKGPLFVNYVLVSSHVPFDRLPDYIEDWTLLGDGSIFHERPVITFENNWLSGGEYPEGYVASVEYALNTAATYAAEIVDDESLFIVLGDHQPRIPISERESTFSVPIHVFSRDPDLVSPFARHGFAPGIAPQQELPHAGMDEFLGMFLDVARRGRTASPAWGLR